jgi:hypothetical protein
MALYWFLVATRLPVKITCKIFIYCSCCSTNHQARDTWYCHSLILPWKVLWFLLARFKFDFPPHVYLKVLGKIVLLIKLATPRFGVLPVASCLLSVIRE